jgi:hypothetical protein
MTPRHLATAGVAVNLCVILAAGCVTPETPPDAPRWSIHPVPTTVIGGDRIAPGHDLYQIRGVVDLPDDGIAVLDGGTQEARRFDREGNYRGPVGRSGDGPGEFRAPIALGRAGDTLLVYDGALRRLSRFDLDGHLLDETPNASSWSWPAIAMLIAAGHDMIAVDLSGSSPIDPTDNTRQHEYAVWHWNTDGRSDSLGTWPGATYLVQRADGAESAWLLPFTPETHVAAGGGRVFVGFAEEYRIDVLSLDGTPLGRITSVRQERQLTDKDHTAMIDWRVAVGTASNAQATRHALESASLPERSPAFGDLQVDSRGLLWVAPTWSPEHESLLWDVWEPDGRLVARVELPAGLRVHRITENFILGVREVESGAVAVERYALHREPASGQHQ